MHPVLAILLTTGLVLVTGCSDDGPTPRAPAPTPLPAGRAPAVQVDAPAPAPAATDAPTAQAGHRLALASEGLQLVADTGSIRNVAFGEPVERVIQAVEKVRGVTAERSRNDECGAGPIDMAIWPDGLVLMSQEGRFAGWSLRGGDVPPAVTTVAGLGPGSTRRDLESAHTVDVRETTLGTEFEAGGLFGVLDGAGSDARITALWAGMSCVFR